MVKLITREKTTGEIRESEEARGPANGAPDIEVLESIWGSDKADNLDHWELEQKINRRLAIFLVALSLASLAGIVVDMGLRYGFSRPWLWHW